MNPDQITDVRVDDSGAVIVSLIAVQAPEIYARRFYVTSSCGICGKASIDALAAAGCAMLPAGQPKLSADLVPHFPAKLRQALAIFEHTGGLHAAGLFNTDGELVYLREDVGRHNAVDKLIGAAFLERQLPLRDYVLMLSGRVSFELVQKAVTAGIPIVIAVGRSLWPRDRNSAQIRNDADRFRPRRAFQRLCRWRPSDYIANQRTLLINCTWKVNPCPIEGDFLKDAATAGQE